MSIKFRKSLSCPSKMLVLKLSSLAVTRKTGGIDKKQLTEIVKDINTLIEHNFKIIVVSSGAINAGKKYVTKISKDISYFQTCASIGQPLILNAFKEELKKYKRISSQVLLTHDDLKNKKRSHNVRGLINSLLANDTIPIINENDSVSYDEITLGDNDQLSAMICELINADVLCMLSQSDGLYDMDPNNNKNAKHISNINYDENFTNVKTISKSSAGKGGMLTKLQAVRKLTPLGIQVVIASFSQSSPVLRCLCQEKGSLFLAPSTSIKNKKKSWIITRVRDQAVIKIDNGAFEALKSNASLLPVGIISTHGKFDRGDSISIKFKNSIVAYGISEYSYKDIEKIKRLKTSELHSVLDYVSSKVVIHKNNMVLK